MHNASERNKISCQLAMFDSWLQLFMTSRSHALIVCISTYRTATTTITVLHAFEACLQKGLAHSYPTRAPAGPRFFCRHRK